MNKDSPVRSTTAVQTVVGTEVTATSSFQKYQGAGNSICVVCVLVFTSGL